MGQGHDRRFAAPAASRSSARKRSSMSLFVTGPVPLRPICSVSVGTPSDPDGVDAVQLTSGSGSVYGVHSAAPLGDTGARVQGPSRLLVHGVQVDRLTERGGVGQVDQERPAPLAVGAHLHASSSGCRRSHVSVYQCMNRTWARWRRCGAQCELSGATELSAAMRHRVCRGRAAR